MTPYDEQILRATDFDDGPGTVVRDFATLLEFVGIDGLRVTGKNFLLPMGRLRELDERMTYPLRPAGQRPQQAAFPHIHALYILFRASGLGVGRGAASKGSQLCVDAQQLAAWQALNPTERYMNLLETWWIDANSSIVGERNSWSDEVLLTSWASVMSGILRDGPRGMSFDAFRGGLGVHQLSLYHAKSLWKLALLDLFGMLEFERDDPKPPAHWTARFVRPTVFGRVLFEAVVQEVRKSEPAGQAPQPEREQGPLLGMKLRHYVLDRVDELHGNKKSPGQSVLQPILKSYFPEWRRTLAPPPLEILAGRRYFRASLGRVWREIAIGPEHTLSDLAAAILDAFGFDHDHLFEFRLRDRTGAALTVVHPGLDDGHSADEFAIGELPLNAGQGISFLYDFGDNWQFDVVLQRIAEQERPPHKPQLVASQGEAPQQYEWSDGDDE